MSEKITIELDAVEALYAINSIAAWRRFVDEYAVRDKIYYDRSASITALKNEILKALKTQASTEDLREGIKVIDSK